MIDLDERKAQPKRYGDLQLDPWFTDQEEFWLIVPLMMLLTKWIAGHTRRGYRPKNVVMVPTDSGLLHARPIATRAQAIPGLLVYRFTHSMYYANARQLSEEMTALMNTAQPPLRWFCIDASAVDDADYSAAETLRRVETANSRATMVTTIHAGALPISTIRFIGRFWAPLAKEASACAL